MTPEALERAAIAAYCAYWEQYGDGTIRHPSGERMTPERAWRETSEVQREQCRLVVRRVVEAIGAGTG